MEYSTRDAGYARGQLTLEYTYNGYTIGHWEGDTLVLDSIGFTDATWLARAASSMSHRPAGALAAGLVEILGGGGGRDGESHTLA